MLNDPRSIDIHHFDYALPDDFIASHPVTPRDSARLLMADGSTGKISESVFSRVSDFLPPDSLLLVNETRVVRARLLFARETGARIEIFILNPVDPPDIQMAFASRGSCVCKAFVGNARRWKDEVLQMPVMIDGEEAILSATRLGRDDNAFIVGLSWEPGHHTFARVLEAAGNMPLPPYIKREATEDDASDYQTVYARYDGSVAAPTAGLHFTDQVMDSLRAKGIETARVVLHVGAGTFKPVNSVTLEDHTMHTEQVVIDRQTVAKIASATDRTRVLVGTTTVRTIESLYWYGVKLLTDGFDASFSIDQWMPYNPEYNREITPLRSLEAVLAKMDREGWSSLAGETQIIIAPGYRYRLTDVLITNFHQPRSTLLLLVSAFLGDLWKEAYQYAIGHRFRFLSYGDACLFFPARTKLNQ